MDEVNEQVWSYYHVISVVRTCRLGLYGGNVKLLTRRLLIDLGDRN